MTYATTSYTQTPEGLTETHADLKGVPAFLVEVSDDHGRTYATNGLRWVDQVDAERWAYGLALRWYGCTDIRVRACDAEGGATGDTLVQVL